MVGSGFVRTSEPEVAYLQLTLGVNEEVAWFEVSVYNVCRMDELEAA